MLRIALGIAAALLLAAAITPGCGQLRSLYGAAQCRDLPDLLKPDGSKIGLGLGTANGKARLQWRAFSFLESEKMSKSVCWHFRVRKVSARRACDIELNLLGSSCNPAPLREV
jgi:hypothetical protein